MQPSSAHDCKIFPVPDKMTAMENQAELFSVLYYYSFVTVSPWLCVGGLSGCTNTHGFYFLKCAKNDLNEMLMCKHV